MQLEQSPPRKLGQIFFISYLFTKPHRLVGQSAQNMHIPYVICMYISTDMRTRRLCNWDLSPFEVSCIHRQFQKKDLTSVQNK